MPSEGPSRRQISVVGGTYLERCQTPDWSYLFGSGLRAACALSRRDVDITLHTYAGPTELDTLHSIAAALGFAVSASETKATYSFRYRHSLADPACSGPVDGPTQMGVVRGEAVLSYGMMEGNAIVQADRAVYDPQSPLRPARFRKNGSEANRLVVIANEGEALRMSAATDVATAGAALLAQENAEAVVIKLGVRGSVVFNAKGATEIPAYRTRSTFLVGSGDIFTAEFAYRWLVEDESTDAAANLASRAVAYYCQNTSVPVPKILPADFTPPALRAGTRDKKRSVYLAGPFFNLQQLWMIDETIAQLSSQGLDVFSPLHDIGFGDAVDVAVQDTKAIEQSDSVFAVLDGYDPGTLFEVGFARAINKPVTAFVSSRESTHLTMLVGTGCDVFHDFVSAVCWEAGR